jgi:GNAT superfamily N-acetyltransferase
VRIAPEPYDAPEPAALRAEGEAEVTARYGVDNEPGVKPSAADVAVFVVARDDDGVPVGCGALRRLDADTLEIKRMYVQPSARGRGLGALLLHALEEEAMALGARRLCLETGPRQPEAMALYQRAGYRRVPCFGAYAGHLGSLCFERLL